MRMNYQKTQSRKSLAKCTYTRRVRKHIAHESLTTGKENSFWKIICAGSADTYWGMEKVMARDGRGARLYSQ